MDLIENAIQSVKEAGQFILSVYHETLEITEKNDHSPVTKADLLSHQVLMDYLSTTDLPVVSEENDNLHMDADTYWLVDPLDGTKDFLARNDSFTINIALVRQHYPVLGVLFAPALDELYVAHSNDVWCDIKGIRKKLIAQNKSEFGLRVTASFFHDSPKVDRFMSLNFTDSIIKQGAALKFAMLARGLVDVYPRFVGTSEWDTAAGQAIIEALGGQVINLETKKRLKYGKRNRRNPSFIAFRSPYTLQDFVLEDLI